MPIPEITTLHHSCHCNTRNDRNHNNACLFPCIHEFSGISGTCGYNLNALFNDDLCNLGCIWI